MPIEVLFVLALHLIAAVVSSIRAFRDGLGWSESLRWGGIGFISGIIGLINRWRMDRRHVHYMQIAQDAVLNLGLEVIALGAPHFLK